MAEVSFARTAGQLDGVSFLGGPTQHGRGTDQFNWLGHSRNLGKPSSLNCPKVWKQSGRVGLNHIQIVEYAFLLGSIVQAFERQLGATSHTSRGIFS